MVDEMDKRWVCPECDGDSTASEGPCDECLESKLPGVPASVIREYAKQTGDEDFSDLEEAYSGTFSSDKEFAQDMAENLGEVPWKGEIHWPFTCIDWEWAAKELMYDYFEIDGYYFRNM